MKAQSPPITLDEFDWDLDVENTKAVGDMIYYFYHHDYHTEPASDVERTKLDEWLSKGPLAQHVRMYAMGEKYGVTGLKALALRKVTPERIETLPGLGTAMVVAYASTPHTEQGMRRKMIEIFLENPHVVQDAMIEKMLQGLPDLVYALFLELWQEKMNDQSR